MNAGLPLVALTLGTLLLSLIPGCLLLADPGKDAAESEVAQSETALEKTEDSNLAADDSGCPASTWYPDEDGDGWGVDEGALDACEPPDGTVGRSGDCDDGDADVNPDASESWYDGVDQDCAEDDDYDADADGFAADVAGGDDCDDTEVDVNPDHREVCGDGMDNDCDGDPGDCDWPAVMTLDDADWMVSGIYVVAAGDFSGDGELDLAGYGAGTDEDVVICSGPDPGAEGACAVRLGPAEGTEPRRSMAQVGDQDLDGYEDLLVGNGDYANSGVTGAVWVVFGPITADALITEISVTLEGASGGDWAGSTVGSLNDWDGDGRVDLAVNIPGYATTNEGAVALFLREPAPGENLDDADALILGESASDALGQSLSGSADLDGDGLADLAVLGQRAEARGEGGAAYVVFGGASGSVVVSDADLVLLGDESGGSLQAGDIDLSEDLDGDGCADLVVGAPETWAGMVYRIGYADIEDSVMSLADDMPYTLGIEDDDAEFGRAVAGLGDVDGDGLSDLAVGAALEDSGVRNGGAYLVFGPLDVGGWVTSRNSAGLLAADDGGEAGSDLLALGDPNADGVQDFIVVDGSYAYEGAAFGLFGRAW